MDREELRRQSYEAWERMAGGWERALTAYRATTGRAGIKRIS